jgi:hypothetical protein
MIESVAVSRGMSINGIMSAEYSVTLLLKGVADLERNLQFGLGGVAGSLQDKIIDRPEK